MFFTFFVWIWRPFIKVEEQRQVMTQNKHTNDELMAANDMIDQLQQTLEKTETKGKLFGFLLTRCQRMIRYVSWRLSTFMIFWTMKLDILSKLLRNQPMTLRLNYIWSYNIATRLNI